MRPSSTYSRLNPSVVCCQALGMGVLCAAALAVGCGDSDSGPTTGSSEENATEGDVAPHDAMYPTPFLGDTANNAVFAVDSSHWEGPIAPWSLECMWNSGVRHLVAGTQIEQVTRQQLEMAVTLGMTVDAYVYLRWTDNADMKAQIDEAFRRVEGFPIGRMWLDIEDKPTSTTPALIPLIQAAVDACREHETNSSVRCGIYTGWGFWTTYLGDTPLWADLPLWHARYDDEATLADWPNEKFGAWEFPVAKQFEEEVICGVGLDKNVMQVATTPTVTVDRTVPPAGELPPVVVNTWPHQGDKLNIGYFVVMGGFIPRATYELEIQNYNTKKKAFAVYQVYRNKYGFQRVDPVLKNTLWRYRIRAKNAQGFGEWTGWTQFSDGNYEGEWPAPE